MSRRRTFDAGLSLIELVVAMALFAVVATMTQQALVAALRGADRLDANGRRLADLQVVVSRVTRDLQAAAPRPPRATGSGPAPRAFTLSQDGRALDFVRVAPPDPTGRPLGAFRRVAVFPSPNDTDRVARAEWRRVDAPPGPPDRSGDLSALVTGLSFEALADTGWTGSWPPGPEAEPDLLPRAVAVTFETARWGPIRRVVTLP